jgi:predicted ATPase
MCASQVMPTVSRSLPPLEALVPLAVATVPYLQHLWLTEGVRLDAESFPTNLPFLASLDLRFEKTITFFVGENGSGKSTLIEAIAELCGLPVAGGGRNEIGSSHAPHARSELAPILRASFKRKPRSGYFFRAEFQSQFASLLEQRQADPDFWGDPYARYGGRSLHARSHGEAFLEVFNSWMAPGILLMDEPEAALSPQRQLALLVQMARLNRRGDLQFIIATHSPILLSVPDAVLLSFDGPALEETTLQDTSHYQITRGLLENPERYWRQLLRDEEPG